MKLFIRLKKWLSKWMARLRGIKKEERQEVQETREELIEVFQQTLAYEIIKTEQTSDFWCRVELLLGKKEGLLQERFVSQNQQKDPEIIDLFGDPRPNSKLCLLHCAPGWDHPSDKVPVLLIHGAGVDANLSWKMNKKGKEGLAIDLARRGYSVFAITFAHPHGDNFMQAEQVANAVARVKEMTGSKMVDMIAHSKGGVPARMYTSNFYDTNWGTPYQGDVRRLILLGTPNRGIDFIFRQWQANLAIYFLGMNSPIAYDRIFGTETTGRSIYLEGGAFPGQLQILYKWDSVYPVNRYNVLSRMLYYGGKGVFTSSKGIDYAIEQGGRLMYLLNEVGVDPSIEISILAGNHHYIDGIKGEWTGPSDGLLFVKSATYSDALLRRGARLKEKVIKSFNHVDLIYHGEAKKWVNQQLNT